MFHYHLPQVDLAILPQVVFTMEFGITKKIHTPQIQMVT